MAEAAGLGAERPVPVSYSEGPRAAKMLTVPVAWRRGSCPLTATTWEHAEQRACVESGGS